MHLYGKYTESVLDAHIYAQLVLLSLPRRQVSLNYHRQCKGMYGVVQSRFKWPVHRLLNSNQSYGLEASNVD